VSTVALLCFYCRLPADDLSLDLYRDLFVLRADGAFQDELSVRHVSGIEREFQHRFLAGGDFTGS
jgi:hypothetical protein